MALELSPEAAEFVREHAARRNFTEEQAVNHLLIIAKNRYAALAKDREKNRARRNEEAAEYEAYKAEIAADDVEEARSSVRGRR